MTGVVCSIFSHSFFESDSPMTTERLVHVSCRYLRIYSIIITMLLILFAALGVWQSLTGQRRIQVAEPPSTVIFVLGVGIIVSMMLSNAAFVVLNCRRIRRMHGRVGPREQLAMFGSLIPWIGSTLYAGVVKRRLGL